MFDQPQDGDYSPRDFGVLFQRIYGRQQYVDFVWALREVAYTGPRKSTWPFPLPMSKDNVTAFKKRT
jgi:hypothetical protein